MNYNDGNDNDDTKTNKINEEKQIFERKINDL